MKTEDFTDKSLELIGEALGLAKNFNNKDITEFHFISKIWSKLENEIRSSQIVTHREFDALTNYWFDNLRINSDEVDKSILSGTSHRILSEAKSISKFLEAIKTNPLHILLAILKVDTKVSVMLRDYGFTPSNILQIDYEEDV
jgi:ATP-dependent Clp protease ATP-binding subunit ClpA